MNKYTDNQRIREFAATGTTQEQIDTLTDTICSLLEKQEHQDIIRWRILGTAKNAIKQSTKSKRLAQNATLYQRTLTALSVGVASIAGAVGNDPYQTIALLVGILITLLIQFGKEIDLVYMPGHQWIEMRQLVEKLTSEVNSYVMGDFEYADLRPEVRWVWLVSRCQKYINDSNLTLTNTWAKTFATEQPKATEKIDISNTSGFGKSSDPSNDPVFKGFD